MREQGQGGRIIVVGSPAGQYGNFGQTNYAAAKAGMVGFARTWALELARASITVNADRPHRLDRDDGDASRSTSRWSARVAAASRCRAAVRREHAIGTARGLRGAGGVSRLGRAPPGSRGQAIGVGGDRLWLYSHPAEIVTELRDGGWERRGRSPPSGKRASPRTLQRYGIKLPKLELDGT